MSSLFDPENKFGSFMGKVGDLMILSFFWSLLSLTVFLAGPACSALYYASVKSIRSEYGIARKEFFRSLRTGWKQGTGVGMLLLAYSLLTYGSIAFSNMLSLEQGWELAYWILARMLILPPVLITVWLFPLMGRFTMKTGELLKTAFYLSVRHLGTTVLLVAGTAAAVFCMVYMPILTLLVPAAYAFGCSYFLEPVFKKYAVSEGEGRIGMWRVKEEEPDGERRSAG